MTDHYSEQREQYKPPLTIKEAYNRHRAISIDSRCNVSSAISAMLEASGGLLQAEEAILKIDGLNYMDESIAKMLGSFARTVSDWADDIEVNYLEGDCL